MLFVADESINKRVGKKVIYLSLTYGKVHTRALKEFTELVKWPDGKKRSRFVPE